MISDRNCGIILSHRSVWLLAPLVTLMCANMHDYLVVAETMGLHKIGKKNGVKCSDNVDCLSGSCFLHPESKHPLEPTRKHPICQCKPCSTAGCGGCLKAKYCVDENNNNKKNRCVPHHPVSSGGVKELNVAVTVVRTTDRFPTEMKMEAPTTMPTNIMAVQLTLPADGKMVEINEYCLKNDDCLSGSCFLQFPILLRSKCQCKACSTAGCGGCPLTKNCVTISPLMSSMCLPTAIPSEIPTAISTEIPSAIPTEEPSTNDPSYGPSYVPSYRLSHRPSSTAAVAQCLENSHCKEGFVCENEYGCRKIACWRDGDCSKHDAYCNQVNICAAKKNAGARCVYSVECRIAMCDRGECQFPSGAPTLSPIDLSSIKTEAEDNVPKGIPKGIALVGFVYTEAKDSTHKGITSFHSLPSHIKLAICAATLTLLLIITFTIAFLLRHSRRHRLKKGRLENILDQESDCIIHVEKFRNISNHVNDSIPREKSSLNM